MGVSSWIEKQKKYFKNLDEWKERMSIDKISIEQNEEMSVKAINIYTFISEIQEVVSWEQAYEFYQRFIIEKPVLDYIEKTYSQVYENLNKISNEDKINLFSSWIENIADNKPELISGCMILDVIKKFEII